MPLFPQTPREVYAKNPLEQVICQFRFPPILKIGTVSPAEFQDSIRKWYPLYEKQVPQRIPDLPEELSSVLKSFDFPAFPQPISHKFSTSDQARSVTLTEGALTIVESKYEKWEVFREEIVKIGHEFDLVYQSPFYNRIGLRYLDKIVPNVHFTSGTAWDKLISRDLIGLLSNDELRDYVKRFRSEFQLSLPDIQNGNVRIRWGVVQNGELKGSSFIIDADFYVLGETEVKHAIATLDKFNKEAGNFFRWAIKDRLRESLEPTGLEQT